MPIYTNTRKYYEPQKHETVGEDKEEHEKQDQMNAVESKKKTPNEARTRQKRNRREEEKEKRRQAFPSPRCSQSETRRSPAALQPVRIEGGRRSQRAQHLRWLAERASSVQRSTRVTRVERSATIPARKLVSCRRTPQLAANQGAAGPHAYILDMTHNALQALSRGAATADHACLSILAAWPALWKGALFQAPPPTRFFVCSPAASLLPPTQSRPNTSVTARPLPLRDHTSTDKRA